MATYDFLKTGTPFAAPTLPAGITVRMTSTTYKGGDGADTVFGTSLSDTIYGNGGSDKIYGGDGGDKIRGGDGDDTLYGQSGDDYLYGGANDDSLYGGSDNDTLYGDAGVDHLEGGTGNDTLTGGPGADYIDGGDGIDTLSYFNYDGGDAVYINLLEGTAIGGDAAGDTFVNIENVSGSFGNDLLVGDSGDNVLNGSLGEDTLRGGDGNDVLHGDWESYDYSDLLYGENGQDILNGWGGDDILDGGRDDDILTGGTGADTFIISDVGDNDDIITDFEFGIDTLHFDSSTMIDDLGDLDGWRVDQDGENLVIDIGSNELTLEGVDVNEFIDFVHSAAASDFFTFG